MTNKERLTDKEQRSTWIFRIITCLLALAQIPAAYFFLVQPMLKGEFFSVVKNGQLVISDFVLFYTAGKMSTSAQHLQVYDPALQLKWMNMIIAPNHCSSVLYFQQVPFLYTLLIPFAQLPITQAYWLWVFLSLALGLSSLYLILKNVRQVDDKYIPFIMLVIVSCLPSYITLYFGQTTWFILTFFCLYFWHWLKKKDILAGICLALSSIKPQYVFFLAMPAVASRRWALLAAALVGEIVLYAAAGLTIGFHNIFNYPHILWQAETSHDVWGVYPERMISLRSLFSMLLPKMLALNLSTIFMVLACPAVLVVWILALKKGRSAQLWAMALTIIFSLTFSTHTHIYDSLLLALPACLTLGLKPEAEIATIRNERLARLSKICLYLWSTILITYALICALLTNPSVLASCYGLPLLAINLLLLSSGTTYFLLQYGKNNLDNSSPEQTK